MRPSTLLHCAYSYLLWKAQFHQYASRGSEGTLELILSVYRVSPETQTQVVKLGGRPLKQLPVPNTCSVPERNT